MDPSKATCLKMVARATNFATVHTARKYRMRKEDRHIENKMKRKSHSEDNFFELQQDATKKKRKLQAEQCVTFHPV
jgi:hypothetical protein